MEPSSAGPPSGKTRDERVLPDVGEYAIVRCKEFRCLAYRDPEGKWRAATDKRELPEILEIVERLPGGRGGRTPSSVDRPR